MEAKRIAAIAAACAAAVTPPCVAQELRAPMTTFFVEVPLGARSAKENSLNFGLQVSGSRAYRAIRIDQRTFRLLPVIAGMEMSWVVAGAIGVTAVAAIAHKDKGTTQQLDQEKQAQLEACPVICAPR